MEYDKENNDYYEFEEDAEPDDAEPEETAEEKRKKEIAAHKKHLREFTRRAREIVANIQLSHTFRELTAEERRIVHIIATDYKMSHIR
jgi:hypothetical protein